MKKALIWIAIIVSTISVIQIWATVSEDVNEPGRDFADQAKKSNRLFRECYTDKIAASCDELDRLYPSDQ